MQKRLVRLAALLVFAVIAHFVTRGGNEASVKPALQEDRGTHIENSLSGARLGPCEVTHVTDGDTLNVRCNGRKERVRMLQIDTPERGEPLYEEAGAALEALIAGRSVLLERGPEQRDAYGRVLATVFVDGENLNLAMIRDGWSPYFDRYGAGAYAREFADAERTARKVGRGIWANER